MKFKKFLDKTAEVLLVVGAINWGLAIWDVNLVSSIFSSMPVLLTTIYALVGLSGVWKIFKLFK